MKNQSKNERLKISTVITVLIIVLPFVYLFFDLSHTSRKTREIFKSFVVGNHISNLRVVNTRYFNAIFTNGNNFKDECLSISCSSDPNCRATFYENNKAKEKEIVIYKTEIGNFLSNNFTKYSSCNGIFVTVMDSAVPVKSTFNVHYDSNGFVTFKDQPITSD